jgi:hypothetical protein
MTTTPTNEPGVDPTLSQAGAGQGRAIGEWISPFTKRKAQQLFTKIRITESELDRLEKQIRQYGVSADVTPDVDACRNHLEVAQNAIGWTGEQWNPERFGYEDVVSAYQALFAAKRELSYLRWYAAKQQQVQEGVAREPTQGSPGAHIVRREATKVLTKAESELSGWALYVILKMLTTDGSQLREDLEIDSVIEAQQVYDEQALKQIEMIDVLERQYKIFMWGAVVGTAAIVVLALSAPYLTSLASWVSGWGVFRGFPSGLQTLGLFGELSLAYGALFYVAVLLFGLLGASISGLLTLRGVSLSARVPLSTIDLRQLALARLATGVGSAFAVITLVESGLPELIFNVPVRFDTPTMALFVAFVAGFSERLLASAVVKITGQEATETDIPSLLRYEHRAESAEPRTEQDRPA